jgi:SAP domain
MKFSGIHFHMVLVVGLICVIIYVFYISKDILTIDSELKNMRIQMETLKKVVTSGHHLHSHHTHKDASSVSYLPSSSTIVEQPKATQDTNREIIFTVQEEEDELLEEVNEEANQDETDNSDNNSVNSEKIKTMLSNMRNDEEENQEILETVEDVEDVEDVLLETQESENSKEEANVIGQLTPSMKELPIAELRRLCKEKGVSAKGSKEQLVQRLTSTLTIE